VQVRSRQDDLEPDSTILVLWLAVLTSWVVAAFWSTRAEKGGGIAADIAFRVLFWVSATLLLAPLSSPQFAEIRFWHFGEALEWTLAALTATGFLFAWWARIHLGRLWSDWLTKKPGHHVVDTGPYRFVRHPIYSGLIVAAFATALEEGNAFALSGAAILTLSFYAKARREECFLRVELGEDAYDAYARRTGMLVPMIGRPQT
jgi:protein-S-isoprenylcysteine O-methyltransferase Ste14